MSAPLLKICGLQNVEVLKSMINLPVDLIGFVFARSKRQVTAERAKELAELLRQWDQTDQPAAAGVFVNPSMEELREVLAHVPLEVVQLHGQETSQFCREVKESFPVSVYKAVSVRSGDARKDHLQELASYAGSIDALLLDTYDPEYGGGSGQTFDWESIPEYQQWTRRHGIPLFVAGGLNADNVRDLMLQFQPDGVDVSSGVESAPGVKDIAKVNAFVERVKSI
ncbi:phosphoribosylanthranilate isomerase [Paenibacillus sp. F411]|uniref:phosphoribosylanthranilate isomerase n=1 Tax=Paenibacillus sp. F411 TaxID=2820239 RepID=UPI001AAE6B51|nr:phosphoribosylanthranilate isomerase [Paenibacillus sp. F411]MBO2945014.1 phosphoribosylanthranilate isomerase [Paenibacillus sp. F411]